MSILGIKDYSLENPGARTDWPRIVRWQSTLSLSPSKFECGAEAVQGWRGLWGENPG